MNVATLEHVGLLVESEIDRAEQLWKRIGRDLKSTFSARGVINSSMYHMAVAEALSTHMVDTTTRVFGIADREASRCALPLAETREIVIEKLKPHFSAIANESAAKAGAMSEATRKAVGDHTGFAFKEFKRRAELYRAGMFQPETPLPTVSITQHGTGHAASANVASPGATTTTTSNAVVEALRKVEAALPASGLSADDIESMREIVALIGAQAAKPKPNRALLGSLLDGSHKVVAMAANMVSPELTTALTVLGGKVASLF